MVPTPTVPDADPILQAAAQSLEAGQHRPDPKALTQALLHAEANTRQQRRQYPAEAVHGTWRLCFTAPKKPRLQADTPTTSGFYIPFLAVAQIAFLPDPTQPEALTIQNQLRLPGLNITFTGPARYHSRKNLLAFDFTHLAITLLGIPLYRGSVGRQQGAPFGDRPISKLPFFAFFAATESYVAARGRGGGLALWIKSPQTPT